jgi:hypothetical protein
MKGFEDCGLSLGGSNRRGGKAGALRPDSLEAGTLRVQLAGHHGAVMSAISPAAGRQIRSAFRGNSGRYQREAEHDQQ